MRRLDALLDEVLGEEAPVLLVFVELLRRQHHAEHGHVVVELHAHQRVDDAAGNEVMAVDAAVDHQRDPYHRGVAPAAGQALRLQRDLEGAGHIEVVDAVRGPAVPRQFGHQRVARAVHDVAVPGGADHADVLPLRQRAALVNEARELRV
jgi:hypothetical protein